MRVGAFARRAPIRALRIACRRLARRARLAALRCKPSPSEPIRTFSVPSGFSSARPSLTFALMAIALLACSTAALGTLLTAGRTDSLLALAGSIESAALRDRMQVAALPETATAPPAQSCCEGRDGSDASLGEALSSRDPAAALASAPPPEAAPPAPEPVVPPPPPAPTQPLAPSAAPALVPPSAPSLSQPPAIPPARLAEAPPVGSFSKPQAEPASDGPFAGVWATDEKACSPQLNRGGLLPALISTQGAWAGETTCSFKSSKRVGNTWTFAAVCSDARQRWKTNIRMSVAGNRLTWVSQRGSQTYVRCHKGLIEALGRKKPMSPA